MNWINQWLRDSAAIAGLRAEWARQRLSDLSRTQYRRGYNQGHTDGVADRGRTFPEKWETTPHPQVLRHGTELDRNIADLIVALWKLGLETQFSCQGRPDQYLPHHPRSWDASAQILFADADQALKFCKKSRELLDRRKHNYPEYDFTVAVVDGVDSDVQRGDVRFSPALLAELTVVWQRFEENLANSAA